MSHAARRRQAQRLGALLTGLSLVSAMVAAGTTAGLAGATPATAAPSGTAASARTAGIARSAQHLGDAGRYGNAGRQYGGHTGSGRTDGPATPPSPPDGAIIVNNGSYASQGDLPTACATPDYTTIQSAVTAASADDTIYVCAGTYDEDVVISTDSLSLLGAEYGTDPSTRTGPETIVDDANGPFQIEADSTIINGFTIEGATNDPTTDVSAYGVGIWTNPSYSGTNGGEEILYNIIQDNIAGIEFDNNGTLQAEVEDNLIQDNNETGPGSGNGIQTSFMLSNALIENNTFSGDSNDSILDDSGSGSDTSITISGNTLDSGADEGIALLDVSDSTISDNVSTGTSASATIDLFGGDSDIDVTGNVLADGVTGVDIENPYATDSVAENSDLTVTENCIVGNSTAGLEEDTGGYSSPPEVDAELNWWGSSTGPTIASNVGGTGDAIIDDDGVITYSPFLTTTTGGSCPAVSTPVIATVSGTMTYGGSPIFTYTESPTVSLTGDLTCTTVNSGTPIASLGVGSYTIDGSSCSGLTAPAGYTLSYTGATDGFVVSPAARSTSARLTISRSLVTYGSEAVETFSGTVTGHTGDGYPEGDVAVSYGSGPTTICTPALTAGTGDTASYSCTLTAVQLNAASYSQVTAVYQPATPSSSNPDYSYTTSRSSPAQRFSVARDTTTTAVLVVPSTVAYGSEQAAVFTATVAAHEGEAVPSGEKVTVQVGSTACTVTLTAGSGTCTIGRSALPPGSYSVSATYGGDVNLSGSTGRSARKLTITRR